MAGHPINRPHSVWPGYCILVLVLCGCLPSVAAESDIDASIQWQTDLETAQQLGAQHNRLVLLHFWSERSAVCEQLEQGVFRDSNFVTALHTDFIPMKINVDQSPQLRRRYRIRQWPTDVVLTAGGEEVYRGLSQTETGTYQGLLTSVARRHRTAKQHPSPVLQSPIERIVQLFQKNPANSHPADELTGELAPPQIGFGIPFDPSEQPASEEPPASRPPIKVAQATQLHQATGSWQPIPVEPSTAPDRRSSFVPRWVEAPSLQQTRVAAASSIQQLAVISQFDQQKEAAASEPIKQLELNRVEHPKPIAESRQTGANTKLGLAGHCPVTLLGNAEQKGNWLAGDSRWGIVHRDRLYLFADESKRDLFLEEPDRFSPVISGYDPVLFADQRQLVDGQRKFGAIYRGQIYLFVSETTLNQFWQSPGKYKSLVDAAMRATR